MNQKSADSRSSTVHGSVLAVKHFWLQIKRIKAVGIFDFESALHVPGDECIEKYLVERITEQTLVNIDLSERISGENSSKAKKIKSSDTTKA